MSAGIEEGPVQPTAAEHEQLGHLRAVIEAISTAHASGRLVSATGEQIEIPPSAFVALKLGGRRDGVHEGRHAPPCPARGRPRLPRSAGAEATRRDALVELTRLSEDAGGYVE